MKTEGVTKLILSPPAPPPVSSSVQMGAAAWGRWWRWRGGRRGLQLIISQICARAHNCGARWERRSQQHAAAGAETTPRSNSSLVPVTIELTPDPAPPLVVGPHRAHRRSSFSPRHRSSSSPPPVPIELTTVQLLPSPPVQLLTSPLVKLLPIAASEILAITIAVNLVSPLDLSPATRHRDDARRGCGRGERVRQDPHSPPPSRSMHTRMRALLEALQCPSSA
jgi:hypothetical protein